MPDDPTPSLIARAKAAQAAVDALLSDTQQATEQMADGTYRVRCMTCGKSVSNPLLVAVIIRAWVECPECIERRVAAPDDTRVTDGLP
jgi:RNA polymerase-binding transcription factor DksA